MQSKQYLSLCLVALVMGQAFALPQQGLQQQLEGGRKFAEKPNAMKKVGVDDLEDLSTNSIQVSMQLRASMESCYIRARGGINSHTKKSENHTTFDERRSRARGLS